MSGKSSIRLTSHAQRRLMALLFVIAIGAASCTSGQSPRSGQDVSPQSAPSGARLITQATRTIRIPVRYLTPGAQASPKTQGPGELTIRPAVKDQLPEGPQSFAILPDKRIVIADPLAERLVVYSQDGAYQQSIEVGVPVSEISADGEFLIIVSASDGAQRRIMLDGRTAPSVQPLAESTPPDVVLDSERSGTIRWKKGQSGPGPLDAGLQVRLEDPDKRLASLRVVAGEAGQSLYVAAESAPRSGQTLDSLGTIVRRYSPSGELQVEVRDIPIDYYVAPTTPFRVLGDTLYQLYPQQDVVLINVWTLQ